jgi:hypothetical protein
MIPTLIDFRLPRYLCSNKIENYLVKIDVKMSAL